MKIMKVCLMMLTQVALFAAYSGDEQDNKYANTNNWQTLPSNTSQPVDVFFVYPSTYLPDPSSNGSIYASGWNQTIEQARVDAGISNCVISKSSVFYKAGTNLYVPYYQQASALNILQTLLWQTNLSNIDAATTALEVAYSDVEKAFDYYMAHYNKDANNKPRPFILAGHSQGSNLLLMLLERRFSDATLRKQLVAAYIIGWSITADDMSNYPTISQLGICSKKEQTGCIITYNTQQNPGDFSQASTPQAGIVQANAYSVNPLSWVASGPNEMESVATSATVNLGALFYEFKDTAKPPQLGPFPNSQSEPGKVVPNWQSYNIAGINIDAIKIVNYTSAQNNNGALVIDPNILPSPGNWENLNVPFNSNINGWYHDYDYSFFFFNLEQNVIDRITSYSVSQ